jgi:hypothetical protein
MENKESMHFNLDKKILYLRHLYYAYKLML